MPANDIYLGPTAGPLVLMTPFGRKLNISDIQLSREDRTASGRLVRDVIATKKEIRLRYRMIDGDELTKYLDAYDTNDELLLRIYNSSGFDDYTVLMDPISRERLLVRDDGLWEGVEIVFREV